MGDGGATANIALPSKGPRFFPPLTTKSIIPVGWCETRQVQWPIVLTGGGTASEEDASGHMVRFFARRLKSRVQKTIA